MTSENSQIKPNKDVEIQTELESLRLRSRGDVFVDLFKEIGEVNGQDIRHQIGHVELVRKINWDSSYDYKGSVILQRFSNSHLHLRVFRFESEVNESHRRALLEVENKYTSLDSGREWPVILVSLPNPMAVNTRIFRRILEILNRVQNLAEVYGINPGKIEWQSIGEEDK